MCSPVLFWGYFSLQNPPGAGKAQTLPELSPWAVSEPDWH